jgi:hypothetical protein
MKPSLIISLLLLGGVCLLGISASPTKPASQVKPEPSLSQAPQQPSATGPMGVVDGANNPELIPDNVAYSLLLRMIGGHRTEAEKGRIRSYIKYRLGIEGPDAEALMALADEFDQRMATVDQKVAQINGGSGPGDTIVVETIAALPTRLSYGGVEKLRQHISQYVKRRVKIVPGPMMPH